EAATAAPAHARVFLPGGREGALVLREARCYRRLGGLRRRRDRGHTDGIAGLLIPERAATALGRPYATLPRTECESRPFQKRCPASPSTGAPASICGATCRPPPR